MENAAAKVYEDPAIVEVIGKIADEPKIISDENVTENNSEGSPSVKRICSSCCCCFVKASNDSDNLEPAGSTALYHERTEVQPTPPAKGFSSEMRSFLNSPVYIIFVVIVTLLTSTILLVEVFIDTGLLRTPDENEDVTPTSVPQEEAQNVSTALHWFSFALLIVFFIEIILRISVWRIKLVNDLISIFDCIVVLIAFLSNLCVTLAVGPGSVIDAISIIIILRLIRIHTLIEVKVEAVRKKCETQLEQADTDLHAASCKLSTLQRQIKEKDYEIKQLQAYLGGRSSTDDAQLVEAMKSMEDQDVKGAIADVDLQMAITLSRQVYDEEANGGFINKAFSQSKGEDLPDSYEDRGDIAVLVHERPDRLNSQGSDIEPVSKVTSYMDEYFSRPIENQQLYEAAAANSGAIGKKKNLVPLLVKANSDNNNVKEFIAFEDALEVPHQGPTTISVDPSILQCDDHNFGESDSKTKFFDSLDHESSSENSPDVSCEEPRSALSSPHSDMCSSDDCNLNSLATHHDTPVKTHARRLKSWAKKSGSSLSSESGYLSEDFALNGNGKKKLTLATTAASGAVANHDTEMSTL